MGPKALGRLPCRSANTSQTGLPTLSDPQTRAASSLHKRLARSSFGSRTSIYTFLALGTTVLMILYHMSGGSSGGVPELRHETGFLPLADSVRKPLSAADPAGPLMVEFTAPGLMVPLDKALDVEFPQQPEEETIYALLPPGGEIPPGHAAGAGPQVTLGEMLDLYRDWRRESEARRRAKRVKKAATGVVPEDANRAPEDAGGDHAPDHATGRAQEEEEATAREFVAQGAHPARRRLLGRPAAHDGDESDAAQPSPVMGDEARILIGVTSACCTPKAGVNRAAARESWVRRLRELHGDVFDIRFFLSQPENATVAAAYAAQLAAELAAHGDLTILRGRDTYVELPNKTFRLFRYGYAHPKQYTHVMKMDDDCYLRGSELLRALGPRHFRPNERMDGSSFGPGGLQRLRAASAHAADDIGDGDDVHSDQSRGRQLQARVLGTEHVDASTIAALQTPPISGRYRMTGVYMGCVENWGGFYPIRDPSSKWYVSEEQLPDSAIPFGVKYAAGWGYLLSRDLVERVAWRTNVWHTRPEQAPAWYSLLAWEDVLVGMVLMDVVDLPESHRGFRPAWSSCPATTVVRHLDVDAPHLLKGLYEQEVSGLWEKKQVQCASGLFRLGSYESWRRWRDSLDGIDRL